MISSPSGSQPGITRRDTGSIPRPSVCNGPFDPNGFTLMLFDGSSQPGRERFTFQNPPASPGNGPVTFQAPPAMKLEPNTTYYLVAAAKYEGVGWVFTRKHSGVVDAGSAAGWSIAGESHFRAPGSGWGGIDTDRSLSSESTGVRYLRTRLPTSTASTFPARRRPTATTRRGRRSPPRSRSANP